MIYSTTSKQPQSHISGLTVFKIDVHRQLEAGFNIAIFKLLKADKTVCPNVPVLKGPLCMYICVGSKFSTLCPPKIYIVRGRFWWILTHKSGVSIGTMYNKAAHGFTVLLTHEHGGHQ